MNGKAIAGVLPILDDRAEYLVATAAGELIEPSGRADAAAGDA
jgi:hypothetical protein